jgi:HD-GYP domain-containing protein (c-di-GMP phosphodiesterase class II)
MGKILYIENKGRKGFIDQSALDKRVAEFVEKIPSPISNETNQAIIEVLSQTLNDAKLGKIIDHEPTKAVVKRLVEEVISTPNTLLRLLRMKKYDDYTFTHSINVCVLSVVTGYQLNMSTDVLEELALGAILHDVGKIFIRKEILNKQGELSNMEFEEIKRHPIYSYRVFCADQNAGQIPRLVAYQHHERYNATGYPQKLSGTQISDYAVITALADVYDALTTDRTYRRKYLPYEAMKLILSLSPGHFCSHITRAFLSTMSIYPPGSIVRLNTGEVGIVVQANKDAVLRPVIKLLVDAEGKNYAGAHQIDLVKERHRYITEAVDVRF